MSRVFPSHKNKRCLATRTKNFGFPTAGKNHLQECDSHQLAVNRKEYERERKMYRSVIVEVGLRLRRVGNGHVK